MEENRKLYAIQAATIRELLYKANEAKIHKEDIVNTIQDKGGYVLLYYC